MGANHVGGITHQIGPTRSSCSRSQAAGLGNCNMYSTVWPVQPTSIGTAPMHSMEPSKERLGRECFIIFQCNTKNSSYLLSGSFFLLCTYIIFWVHTHIYIYICIYCESLMISNLSQPSCLHVNQKHSIKTFEYPWVIKKYVCKMWKRANPRFEQNHCENQSI